MYSIITFVFLLYNLLFLFLSYYCYKIHKYVKVLNNRITNYNAMMSLLVNNDGFKEICGEGNGSGRGGGDGSGHGGGDGSGRGRGDGSGRGGDDGRGGGDGSGRGEDGRRGDNYRSMLISIINNANIDDNEFKVLIELYVQVIKSCKSIYAKFINIYTKKIEDM